jgi:ribosome maturation factor RimP
VDVKMRTRDESGRKRFTGLLRGAADGVAMVEVDGREVALRLDEIDRARLVPT